MLKVCGYLLTVAFSISVWAAAIVVVGGVWMLVVGVLLPLGILMGLLTLVTALAQG